jgi:hypothetical protein
MLQVAAQYHQVVEFAVNRVFHLPEKHLEESFLAGYYTLPLHSTSWAKGDGFHQINPCSTILFHVINICTTVKKNMYDKCSLLPNLRSDKIPT